MFFAQLDKDEGDLMNDANEAIARAQQATELLWRDGVIPAPV